MSSGNGHKKRASGYPEALKQKLLTIEVYVWVYLVGGIKPSNFYRRLRRARNPAANNANTETPGSGITTPTGTA